MSDIQILLVALALAAPLFLILKPLLAKGQIPHASGGKFLTGHTDNMLTDPVNTMKDLREKYGSLYSVNYLGKKVFIFGKKWIGELSKNKELMSEEAINELFLITESIGAFKYIQDPNLSTPKVVRSFLAPYLKSYSNRIYEQVKLVEKEFFESKDSNLIESPAIIMRKMVVKATSNIILGKRLSGDNEILEAFYSFPIKVDFSVFSKIKCIKYPIIGRLYASYLHRKEKIHLPYHKLFFSKISEEIAIRNVEKISEESQRPYDLLQRMLDEGYNFEEISNLSLILAIVSVLTVTNSLTLALYDLVTYPEYYNELYEEQLQIKKDFGDDFSPDVVSKMLKLNSFIRESMRFRLAGVTNFRITKSDWVLSDGKAIPKGSIIGVDAFSIHFDDELQDGNSNEFLPFRHFANGKLATKVEPQNLSFGFGIHACPGRHIAIQEICTVLSILIRNYKISTKDGKPHPYMVKPAPFDLPKGEPLIFSKIYI